MPVAGTRFAVRCCHEFVQDAAIVSCMGFHARVAEGAKLTLERVHALQTCPHARQLLVDQVINVAALGFWMRGKVEQSRDRRQRHVEGAAMTDESQSFEVRYAVHTISVSLACRLG